MFVFHGYESTLIFWVAIVLIVFFSCYFRYRSRASRYRLMETFAEKGQPVPPELLSASCDTHRYGSPVQSGLVLMGIGIAIAVFFLALSGGGGYFGESNGVPGWLPAIGIFPFMIGLARLLGWFGERKRTVR